MQQHIYRKSKIMKNFFRKLFFYDDPVAGAVFGMVLSLIAGFSLANLACLSDMFFSVWRMGSTDTSSGWIFLIITAAILQLTVSLYCIALLLAFFYRQDASQYKWGFYLIIFLHLAADVLCGIYFSNEKAAFAAVWFINIAGFNALCVRKHNFYWYILALIGWSICLVALGVIMQHSNIMETYDAQWYCPIPVNWRIPLVYASVPAFAVAGLACFKLWASAVGKRLREVWSIPCTITVAIGLIVYLAITAAALYKQHLCSQIFAELEANFQRKISAAALKEHYYRNRKTDKKFHENLKKILNEFCDADKDNSDFRVLFCELALDKLPPEYCNKFSSPEAEAAGRFFDSPLPADERDYRPGYLLGMMLPDLQPMRSAARFFNWQMKIASQKKDRSRAMLAWQRSQRITDSLKCDTTLISMLVFIAVEQIRLDGLEQMLSGNILTGDDLDIIQQYMVQSAGNMKNINRNALYFEAVMGEDILNGLANGSISQKHDFEGLAKYRFLAPGMWYLGCCNYYELMKMYNHQSLCHVNDDIKTSSPEKILAAMLIPALSQAGKRMHDMEMRYQAFNVLIEAEKIKRRTGKYPEKLPLPVTDHFSSKPLNYKIGSHQIKEAYLTGRKKGDVPAGSIEESFELKYNVNYRNKTVQGIAVWSIGKNKTDEDGDPGSYPSRSDDQRALLIFK